MNLEFQEIEIETLRVKIHKSKAKTKGIKRSLSERKRKQLPLWALCRWGRPRSQRSACLRESARLGTGILVDSNRSSLILFGYSSGLGVLWWCRRPCCLWKIRVQRRQCLGISTFANRTTTSSSSSFSLILISGSDRLLWWGSIHWRRHRYSAV